MNPGVPAGAGPTLGAEVGHWLVERYEELRRQCVEKSGGGARGTWGRGVLKSRGMAEWARVCAVAPREPAARREGVDRGPVGATARVRGDEVVRVLAGMVWNLQREGAA